MTKIALDGLLLTHITLFSLTLGAALLFHALSGDTKEESDGLIE